MVHDGEKFHCESCDNLAWQHIMNQFIKKRNFLLTHVTISKNNLKTHEDSLHGGKKFLWGLCAYLATYKSNIRTHIKLVHDGEKFPCESFENIAWQHRMNQFIKKINFLLTHVTISKNNLKTHEDSLHGGKKFLWGLCAYLATYKSNIRTHIKLVHDGEKFPCESCDNLAWQHIMDQFIKKINFLVTHVTI